MIEVYVDGSGKGDAVFYIRNWEEVMKWPTKAQTHNEAEYYAVHGALQRIANGKIIESVTVYSDSLVVVSQLNKEYNIKKDALRNIALTIWEIVAEMKKRNQLVTFIWVPREQNLAGKILG